MSNMLEYKGYHAKIEFDSEDPCIRGKIEGINDLITFVNESATNIEQEFHDAVDDYLLFCEEIGKVPEKESKDASYGLTHIVTPPLIAWRIPESTN